MYRLIGLGMALIFCVLSSACGDLLLDQTQEVSSSAFAMYDWALPFSQSFEAGLSGGMTQIDVRNNSSYSGVEFTLDVFSGSGTGGSRISRSAISLPSTAGWVSLGLDQPAMVTSGQTYTFAITAIASGEGFQWIAGAGNPYPNGQLESPGYATTDYDFCFRTYVDTAIPEPYTFSLLLLGLVMTWSVRRKRC